MEGGDFMTEENNVMIEELEEAAKDNLSMSANELEPKKAQDYAKLAETQLAIADKLKPKSWWDRPLISVKDIVIGLAAPIAGLIGAVYAANCRKAEAELGLEAERVKAQAQVDCEIIRSASRIEQLKLITNSQELPDNFSLKVLNENNK